MPCISSDLRPLATRWLETDGLSMAMRRSRMGLAGLGMELAAAVLGLTLLGYWIDSKYGSEPWGVLIGAVVGITGGLLNFVRAAYRAQRQHQSDASDG